MIVGMGLLHVDEGKPRNCGTNACDEFNLSILPYFQFRNTASPALVLAPNSLTALMPLADNAPKQHPGTCAGTSAFDLIPLGVTTFFNFFSFRGQ